MKLGIYLALNSDKAYSKLYSFTINSMAKVAMIFLSDIN